MARPSKYDPAFCEAILEFGRQGYSKAEMAAGIDVSRETLDEWAKVREEFSDALHRAREFSLAWWERKARENLATQGFQSALWGRAMSGRFPAEPYRERQEHTGPNGGPVQFQSIERRVVDPRD